MGLIMCQHAHFVEVWFSAEWELHGARCQENPGSVLGSDTSRHGQVTTSWGPNSCEKGMITSEWLLVKG